MKTFKMIKHFNGSVRYVPYKQIPEFSSRNHSNVYDRATLDLGLVQNTGHVNSTLNQGADVLTLHINMAVLQHPLNTVLLTA